MTWKVMAGAAVAVLFAGALGWRAAASRSASGDRDLDLPQPGEHALHILSPTLLELVRINTTQPNSSRVDSWDFVAADGKANLPLPAQFAVQANGQPVALAAVGFKRRPLYAPLAQRDLRIDNRLYLQLARPLDEAATVSVANPDGTLWPAGMSFRAVAEPHRESAAIHVNQEGYAPDLPKKAMIGCYLGSLGEMDTSSATDFSLVDAISGATVFHGALHPRRDVGYAIMPLPYQKVLEADFGSFTTPGKYRLAVPGLGASLPFAIDAGLPMNFTRAYALGLYHQRCGTANALPYTRHTHAVCHIAPAEVPSPASAFASAWAAIASGNADCTSNPRHTAPRLANAAAQLYPFVRTGRIDVSGGHHDAGDYSKYTIDSALLIHALVFAADAFPGVGALDNLGLPESGDGRSDILQEAKWEADFLAKMQDSDGGFYFLVYPRNRKYEDDVLPDHGDPQIVWPKNTAATAAAVAALAQTASSPLFKAQFPDAAADYLRAARRGWDFLTRAIAAHGKDGAYQKLTHYGDTFMHDDELAWAACEMFLATGDPAFQRQLAAWYDPASPATLKWSWQRLCEGYGCAARSYTFAARTGRLGAGQLDPAYLAKCTAQIIAAGDDALARSQANAYGTAFELESKRIQAGGWYFSCDRAFDITTAHQLHPRPEYLDAIVTNLNYEGGCNPVNRPFITGMGALRQHEIVHQYARNDRRNLPPSGLPVGNLQTGFADLPPYGGILSALTFPSDRAPLAPFAFYDRWADAWNVTTEAVVVNQARGLACVAARAAQTELRGQRWNSAAAQIITPRGTAPSGHPVTVSLRSTGLDFTGATVLWEARNQRSAFGGTDFTFTPAAAGEQWVEAEAHWPDGRRVFAAANFSTVSESASPSRSARTFSEK